MIFSKALMFLINIIFGSIEFLIGLRVILKLFAASTRAPFVAWVYRLSDKLLKPFAEMFQPLIFPNGFVIDLSSVFAFLSYAFVGLLASKAIEYISHQLLIRKR